MMMTILTTVCPQCGLVFVADTEHTMNVCPFCNRGFKLQPATLLEAQLQQEDDERQA